MATWRNSLFFCSFLIFLCWAEATKRVNKKELKDSPGCRDAVSGSRIICGEPIGENCLEDSCYTFNSTKYTWEESRKQCQKNGGDLVSIETKEEMEFLLKRLRLVFPKRGDKAFYIGLFVEESPWEWVNGKPLTYDRWERGQTYNSAPNLNQYSYAHMYLFPSHFRYGDFTDHRDYLKQSSICEIPANRYNDTSEKDCYKTSCYEFVLKYLLWGDARKECKNRGGDLVSIETECERIYIYNKARLFMNKIHVRETTLLIGLKKKPVTSWKWVSNAAYTLGKDAWTLKGPKGRTPYAFLYANDKISEIDTPKLSCEEKGFICEKKLDYKPPEK